MTDATELDEAAIRARLEAARPITGAPGYLVSPDGTIWSSRNWRGYGLRPVTPVPEPTGHLRVRLSLPDGRRVRKSVHGIVARTFLGPANGLQVCHRNGDPTDNGVDNLYWGSAQDNANDRDSHGTTARGERNGYAKLTSDGVARIRARVAAGESTKVVADDYEVHRTTVQRIVAGRRWGHVA